MAKLLRSESAFHAEKTKFHMSSINKSDVGNGNETRRNDSWKRLCILLA